MTRYFPRELSEYTEQALQSMPVVVITGPRQSGKSTFIQKDPIFKNRKYYTFDDFETIEAARRNPDAFIESDGPITVDEAQRFPEIFLAIKRAVDRKRRAGQFLLSGSANFALLHSVAESLAGRAIYLKLLPFTRREIANKTRELPFIMKLLRSGEVDVRAEAEPIRMEEVFLGGMPTVALENVQDPRMWFLGYEQTYLERDIRNISQIADLTAFRNLLKLTALRTGQVINESSIGRDAKLSPTTASRYISILETSYAIHRLAPFLRSKASRVIKSPKVYISDSGLACHLTGIEAGDLSSGDPLSGALFETYVFQNLVGILSSCAPDSDISFWNVQSRSEVDFVISYKQKTVAVEVKSSSQFDDRDFAGIRSFVAAAPKVNYLILAFNGKKVVKIDDQTFAVPVGLLLS